MSVSGYFVAAIQREFLKNSVSEDARKFSIEHLVELLLQVKYLQLLKNGIKGIYHIYLYFSFTHRRIQNPAIQLRWTVLRK